MEMILILTILGVLFWVIKITFIHTPAKKELANKDKRVPIANTFAEPVPEVPANKIKCGDTPLADSKALVGGTMESFGIGAGAVNIFYDED
jgi:hypothetical protein